MNLFNLAGARNRCVKQDIQFARPGLSCRHEHHADPKCDNSTTENRSEDLEEYGIELGSELGRAGRKYAERECESVACQR
jgi:hypothetical protein